MENETTLTADYLVIGSGAMGMAFTDALIQEADASVVLVDRHHRPGGHWNDSYAYVRLHQPSSFYGVNSRHLGSDVVDQTGWNKGLHELASGAEVCNYFDQIMQQQFLPSGRVQYFPMCDYLGETQFRSLVSGREYTVSGTCKVVDATYMDVVVPAMRIPPFSIATDVRCIPLNDLTRIDSAAHHYVVIGGGKTAMDACLWLLENSTDPNAISWVMPRDSWILDRANIQPGGLNAARILSGAADTMSAVAKAESVEELFDSLEAAGELMRLDANVRPTMFRCATVTEIELEALRSIHNIIRKGRVTALTEGNIVLEQGTVAVDNDTLFIDCAADGLKRRPVLPVFQGNSITLQSVRTCQQVFSAAFIGHVEAGYEDEQLKNELCAVVPHPNSDMDWLRNRFSDNVNTFRWNQDPNLMEWLRASRLDPFNPPSNGTDQPNGEDAERISEMMSNAPLAMQKLQQLLGFG
ncbi:MAG: FAD/NAD(P)-binding protein [Pseudomonadales bacterium]